MFRFLLLVSLAACSSLRPNPITETIAAKKDSYRFCFLSSKDHKSGLELGTATASFLIDQHGNPSEVKLLETNIKDPQFEKCFLNTLSNLKFTPSSDHTTIEVKQPFTFKE